MRAMTRKSVINAIWRLTFVSFVFVQVIGILVVVSVISSEDRTPEYQVIGAYLLFLLFSGFVFLVARRIRRLVEDMYGE